MSGSISAESLSATEGRRIRDKASGRGFMKIKTIYILTGMDLGLVND